ncbi:MAG: hypothetical protein ACTSQV_06680 [Alphaproteobacteria bacterium]
MAAEGARIVVNDISDPSALVAEITEAGGKAIGIGQQRRPVRSFGDVEVRGHSGGRMGRGDAGQYPRRLAGLEGGGGRDAQA